VTTAIEGRVPSVARAEAYLSHGAERTPGPWIAHRRHVAGAARRIAEAHPNLDAEVADSLGLLHDIGYRGGFQRPAVRHVLDSTPAGRSCC
jgi:hypothetical protein